jgi:VCBS repeat-containing protein
MIDTQNTSGHGRHIGRVGALAAALGTGFAIALLTSPTAAAETDKAETATTDKPAAARPAARTNRSAVARADQPATAGETPKRNQRQVAAEPTQFSAPTATSFAMRSAPAPAAAVAPSAASVAAPSAASIPTLTPQTPDVFAPNLRGVVYGGARIRNVRAGALTFTTPTTSAGGGAVTINPNTGAFSYTPTRAQRQAAGLTTTDTFTITATNAQGVTTNQLVTVVVDPGTPMPRTPWVPRPDSFTGVVRGTSKFNDESGRTLTYSTPGTTSGGGAVTIDAATGNFVYTPTRTQRQAAGLTTTDTFTVTADNGVRTSTQVITVAVDPGTPFSNTPWVRSPNNTTSVVTGIAKFVEPSGRTLTYSTPTTSTGGGAVSINAATGDFTYTPTATQRQNATAGTTDTFTITANNGVRTTTQTVTVSVIQGTAPIVTTPVTPPAPPPMAGPQMKTYSGSLSDSPTTVFTNTKVSEIVQINGRMSGGWIDETQADPYHFTNDALMGTGDTASIQFHTTQGEAKVVKVLLTQSGPDVVASVVYAKRAPAQFARTNFDFLADTTATAVPIATSGTADGYGVSSLSVLVIPGLRPA